MTIEKHPSALSQDTLQKILQEALSHHQSGRILEAQELYSQILKSQPKHSDSLHLMGLIAQHKGHLDQAANLIKQALQTRKKEPVYLSNLANVLKDQGNLEEATALYEQTLAIAPNFAEAHYNFGTILQAQKKNSDAINHYKAALDLNPHFAAALNNLGNILKEQGQVSQAQTYFKQAIECAPNFAEPYYNLGTLYKDQDRFDEALDLYERAIRLKRDYSDAHSNLGALLQNKGDLKGALEHLETALSYKKDDVTAHVNRALILLRLGQFDEGWEAYEWRLRLPNFAKHNPSVPVWTGQDLSKKTIVLFCEQGFGDSIQFIRYTIKLKDLGARVIVSCPSELCGLFRSVEGIDQILPYGQDLPAHDYYSPLLSLPYIFKTTLETIPQNVPYIFVTRDQFEAWSSFVSPYHGIKVGLVWAGNSRLNNPDAQATDRRRSMRLSDFSCLQRIPGVNFFSLQKQASTDPWLISPSCVPMINLMDKVVDFTDTAALIANLDLVIGVDTAVIHLAGALGKPVWVLSRFDRCWRWLLDREDSPWYPTLKLFTQPRFGKWEEPLEQVYQCLSEFARHRQT